jgi:hypothetical protein
MPEPARDPQAEQMKRRALAMAGNGVSARDFLPILPRRGRDDPNQHVHLFGLAKSATLIRSDMPRFMSLSKTLVAATFQGVRKPPALGFGGFFSYPPRPANLPVIA